MALNLREVFPILEDSVSGYGVAPTRVQVGSSPSGVNGMMTLPFKDSNGNLALANLDPNGRLIVTPDQSMPNLNAEGILAGGATSGLTAIPGASVVLVSGKTYQDVAMIVCSTQTTWAQLVQNNNGSLTVLGNVIVGPGQFTATFSLEGMTVTAGATGTQTLFVQAENVTHLSDIYATINANQLN